MNEIAIPDQGIDIVLVVESEVLVRHALAEYLRHCGYRVIEAASTQEAMTLLNNATVSVERNRRAGGWLRAFKMGSGEPTRPAGHPVRLSRQGGSCCGRFM